MHSMFRNLTPIAVAAFVLLAPPLLALATTAPAPILAKRATDPLACAYALADSLDSNSGVQRRLFWTVLEAYGASLDEQEASIALRGAIRSAPFAMPGEFERVMKHGRIDGLLLAGRTHNAREALRGLRGDVPSGDFVENLCSILLLRGDEAGRAEVSEFLKAPSGPPRVGSYLVRRHARRREWRDAVALAHSLERPTDRSEAVRHIADELERAARWDDTPPQVSPSILRPLTDDTALDEDERRRLLQAAGVEVPRVPPFVPPPPAPKARRGVWRDIPLGRLSPEESVARDAARWAEAGFFQEAEAFIEEKRTWLVDTRARVALAETLFSQGRVDEAIAAADRIPHDGWRAQALVRIAFTLLRRGEESWSGVALSSLRATLEQFPLDRSFDLGRVFANLDDGSPASWDAWLRIVALVRGVAPTRAGEGVRSTYFAATTGIVPGRADDLLPLVLETARPPTIALASILRLQGHGVDAARLHFLSGEGERERTGGDDPSALVSEDIEALAAAGAELRRAGRPVPDFLLDAMASLPACRAD